MKIRFGFVSNSSTCSNVLIFARITIYNDRVKKIIGNINNLDIPAVVTITNPQTFKRLNNSKYHDILKCEWCDCSINLPTGYFDKNLEDLVLLVDCYSGEEHLNCDDDEAYGELFNDLNKPLFDIYKELEKMPEIKDAQMSYGWGRDG